MIAILTSSCTVKYSTHLEEWLLPLQCVLHREIALEGGPGWRYSCIRLERWSDTPRLEVGDEAWIKLWVLRLTPGGTEIKYLQVPQADNAREGVLTSMR